MSVLRFSSASFSLLLGIPWFTPNAIPVQSSEIYFSALPQPSESSRSLDVLAQNLLAQSPIKSQANQLLNLGIQDYKSKNFKGAIQSWQQALQLFQDMQDSTGQGLALGRLGLAYQSLGQSRQAIDYFNQALPIVRQTKSQTLEATILGNLGNNYFNISRYAQSIDAYNKSIFLWKKIDNKSSEGQAYQGLGNVYIALGKYPEALSNHQQGLKIAQSQNKFNALANSYNSLGVIQSNQGHYQKASQFFQQSLTVAQKVEDTKLRQKLEAQVLNNFGITELSEGNSDKALSYYQRGLDLAQSTSDLKLESTATQGIASVHTSNGNNSEALAILQKNLVIARQLKNPQIEASTLHLIGANLWKLGRLSEAETHFKSALVLLEDQRNNLDDIDKVSIFDTQIHSYALLRRVLAEQGKYEAALEAAERGKSRAFVELLTKRLSPNSQSTLSQQGSLPNLQNLRKVAQQQNATLVEYAFIADENFVAQGKLHGKFIKIYIWVVQPTGKITFREVDLTPTQAKLLDQAGAWANKWKEATEDQFSDSLEPLQQEFQQLHKDLYSILITPIQDQLPTDQTSPVIFIPYNQLYQVSFPALQAPDGTYLIQKHTILTAPAIQVIELASQLKTTKIANSSEALVIGNPKMPLPILGPLPGAEQEAQTIGQLLNTQALIGESATETTVKQRMGSARIIHFATHGLLNEVTSASGVPGAIALARDSKNDGLLKSDEILDLKLNADLVVVSACDTGRGQLTGDGVVGLSRSIMAAGVPNVMVTLWSTSDESTAVLMEEFYRLYSQNPNKAQALRQAMLKTMEKYPHPVFWAPFNLVGQAR